MNKNDIIDAINGKSAFLFKLEDIERLYWIDFIQMINYAYSRKNPTGSNYGSKEIIGSINFWHRLTMTIDLFSDELIAKIQPIIEILSKIHPGYFNGLFSAISFTDKEPTTSKHTDPVDVFYFQCLGRVEWDVSKDGSIITYKLLPGDVIFVPANVAHEVRSLSPRAAISFMFR